MEQTVSQSLFEGIKIVVQEALKQNNSDKTYFGIIKNYDEARDVYSVMINGKLFEKTKSFGKCDIGEKVLVLFPQNQPEHRIILKVEVGETDMRNKVNSITYTGTYATSTYFNVTGSFATITDDDRLIIIMQGGTSTAYENIYFSVASKPTNVTFVGQSIYNYASASTGQYYCAIFKGITKSVNIAIDMSSVNATYDYVTASVTITEVS